MVTLVGTQAKFSEALKEIIELDYDAIEAYKAAIDRLESDEFKRKLEEFKQDHERHVREISDLLKKHSITPPKGPDSTKQILAKGKVMIGGMVGDITILRAMSSNEEDTNTAYERLNSHKEKWEDAEQIIFRAWQDEKKHKKWLDETIDES